MRLQEEGSSLSEGGLVLVGNESIFSTLSRDTTRTVPTTLPWGWYFLFSLIA